MRLSLRDRPELLPLGLAVGAWVWMACQAFTARRLSCCAVKPTFGEDLIAWCAMVVAMMFPAMLGAVREVARQSYRDRRLRSVAGYLGGYGTAWAVPGVAFAAVARSPLIHDLRAAAFVCALGAAWAFVPARARWLALRHRGAPLHPTGWRADASTLRLGAAHGAACVATCWPAMLACAMTNHHLPLMVAGTALAIYEKRMWVPRAKPIALASLAMAAWTFALAFARGTLLPLEL